jgi:bacterioferritin
MSTYDEFIDTQRARDVVVRGLQTDLANEVRHMMFYLKAATMVEGLHREELREFFMKEAHEEMGHVHEFADLLSYFGKTPDLFPPVIEWGFGGDPYLILKEVVRMENEVAANYAYRLQQTEAPELSPTALTQVKYDPWVAAAHVFYEDQIKNSQMTAWEVGKWLTKFPVTVTTSLL